MRLGVRIGGIIYRNSSQSSQGPAAAEAAPRRQTPSPSSSAGEATVSFESRALAGRPPPHEKPRRGRARSPPPNLEEEQQQGAPSSPTLTVDSEISSSSTASLPGRQSSPGSSGMTVDSASKRTVSSGSVQSTKSTASSSSSLPTTDDEAAADLRSIAFDKDGDLCLAVGTAKVNPLNFVVCSRTLSRASPVFKTMLYGPFAESRGSRRSPTREGGGKEGAATTALGTDDDDRDLEWTVELPDDDPGAFRTLMGIIHSAFEHVPKSIGLMELFQMAILTDKYDMTHLLRPWAAAWCEPHHAKRHPYRLWIAWVLGDARMFESEARRLVQTCSVNAMGQLLVRCTNGRFLPLETFDYLRVPDILESIAATRFDAADQLLQHLDAMHKSLATANGSLCKEHGASHEARLDCENALLGSAVKALDACELWPIPATPLLTFSVDALAAKVSKAAQMIRPLQSHQGGSGGGGSAKRQQQQHCGCNPAAALDQAAKRIMATIPSPVQHYHLAHMAHQVEKQGLVATPDGLFE